jgi:xanthine dehydrogenase/oxidase
MLYFLLINTSVRTFGGIQAIYFIESILNDIALKLNVPVIKIQVNISYFYFFHFINCAQEANFYKYGQTTPIGAPILEPDFTLHYIWADSLKNSQFYEKEKQIEEFNKANRWRKRGISVVPLRYSPYFYFF